MRRITLRQAIVLAALLCLGFSAIFVLSGKRQQAGRQPQTTQDWVAYVKEHGIANVPGQQRNKEVVKAYLQAFSEKLSPEELVGPLGGTPAFDAEMAQLAVSLKPATAFFLPVRLQSLDLFKQAFKQDSSLPYLFSGPERDAQWTSDMALASFEANPKNVFDIRPDLVTSDMLKQLINQKLVVKYVKEVEVVHGSERLSLCKGWNQQLANRAWNLSWKLFAAIPKQYRTYEMSKAAVSKDGTLLEYVPRDQKFQNNGELCRIALKQNDEAARFVPDYFKYRFEP